VALLKGRNNYLCLHRLEVAEEGRYSSREMAQKNPDDKKLVNADQKW